MALVSIWGLISLLKVAALIEAIMKIITKLLQTKKENITEGNKISKQMVQATKLPYTG